MQAKAHSTRFLSVYQSPKHDKMVKLKIIYRSVFEFHVFWVTIAALITNLFTEVSMKKFLKPALLVTAMLFSLNASAELKIAYIEMAQVMQSQQAQDIGKKLQTEFSSRANQLDQLKKTLNDKRTALEKDSKKLSEADMRDKSKQISDLTIDFERKQRELNEDVNIRKNEEMAKFQQQLNKAVSNIAQADGYDLIVYNSVAYASKKINITDKVIAAIGK